MEPSFLTTDEYVPKPFTFTPNILPLSSNETSTVGGSTDNALLTSLLPVVSPINSPSIFSASDRSVKLGLPLQVPKRGRILHRLIGSSGTRPVEIRAGKWARAG